MGRKPGKQLDCQTILVLTGHGQEHKLAREKGFQPDHIADDLYQAAEWIVSRENSARL